MNVISMLKSQGTIMNFKAKKYISAKHEYYVYEDLKEHDDGVRIKFHRLLITKFFNPKFIFPNMSF